MRPSYSGTERDIRIYINISEVLTSGFFQFSLIRIAAYITVKIE
jgi:hypothetical protein